MLLNDPPRSIVAALRSATGGDHDRVDTAYGDFDLAAPDSYRAFLHAHALALPAAEDALAAVPGLPHFRARTPLLAADLAALDEAMPPPLPFALPAGDAAAWGALYVVEGSRLGGIMLARTVPDGLPIAYLGARHLSGEWRELLGALDNAATLAGSDVWIDEAITGARATFDLYRRAAAAR
jgi:heme oxygenase